jgi:hypothetical protein
MPPFGLPRDPAQWLAVALAACVLFAGRTLFASSSVSRRYVALAAAAAAALSAVYVVVYLRGGPRIIDATSYYLEGRSFAEGFLSFPVAAPESAVLGRFLVRSVHADGVHAAVIFPPGYPALLALGFLVKAPLAIGPLLAAAIAVVTFDLAARVAASQGLSQGLGAAPVAKLAVLLSVACAALRYHTADTMSHGLAALCFSAALVLVLRAADASDRKHANLLAAAAGLAAGWLFATRPVSAVALAVTLGFLVARDPPARARRVRLALGLVLGSLPGVALFLAHQHAATGAWGFSAQRLYYALADGPPDCFRYGFGAGIGCLGEHGDFVRARLAHGFGLLAAAGTTLRRLKQHLVDPLNIEPLALLVLAGVYAARESVRGRALGLALVAQILAYVPFYFDGNYPGGGARFYADVLPIEHVLIAVAVVRMAPSPAAVKRWAAGTLALALVGFAVRAGFDHALLRDREGGRPFFDSDELARAGVSSGLLFIDSDHGFDLAFDPAKRSGVEVARYHGDALDRATWEAKGRPPAHRYRFDIPPGDGHAHVAIEPMSFSSLTRPLVIEGESLWPPLAQRGGWALPEWAAGSCASGDRWLAVERADHARSAVIQVALPARWLEGRALRPRIAASGQAHGTVELAGITRRFGPVGANGITCVDLPPIRIPSVPEPLLEPLVLTLNIEPSAEPERLALDALEVITDKPGE